MQNHGKNETNSKQNKDWFEVPNPREKISLLPEALQTAFSLTRPKTNFCLGRDIRVVPTAQLPPKLGLGSKEGQGRLLHDLASIELQAMELGARTLFEFPEAPAEFRKELAIVVESESQHLQLCLNELDSLGYQWGDWDVRLALWDTVSDQDSLIERVLIVHRYLEGSGLDAGESIMRRLLGVASKSVRRAVGVIVEEEVEHVLFGSRWYHKLCAENCLDPEAEFSRLCYQLSQRAPRREKISLDLRRRAGFTEFELEELEKLSQQNKFKNQIGY